MSNSLCRWLVFGWLWLLSCAASAASQPVVIELSQGREYFIAALHELYTTTGDINPQMSVPEPSQRVPLDRLKSDVGSYWVHMTLLNRSSEREWMLDVSNAVVQHLIVHSISSSRHRISEQGFVKTWPFDLRYGTELALTPNEITEVWIHVQNPFGSSQPLFSVLPMEKYQQKSSSYSMHLLIALGALVILAIYQIVIFVPTRDGAYGWSALTHLAAAFAWAVQCKSLLYSVSLGAHWYSLYLPLFVALAGLLQFGRHYLRVHYPHPLAYALDAGTTIVLICAVAGLLLPVHQYPWLLTKVAVLALILMVAAGIWRWRERFAAIRYYQIGVSVLLVCYLFYLLDQALKLYLVENGILAAARLQLLVMILFMLGLIDRMSLVQRERSQQNTRTATDPVTGLPNRTAFERDVRAWEAYCNEGILTDFYLSFFDVNSLQETNKSKGHKEGDRLLVLVGKWLLQQSGNHNVYRIGGDEFLVLSQKTIHWDMAALDRYLRQEGYRNIQVSIGSSCYSESSCRSSLLKIADERLHKRAME